MERKRPVLIVAPTYQVAEQAALDYELGQPGSGWRFVTTMRDVQGQTPGGHYLAIVPSDVSSVSINRFTLMQDAVAVLERLRWHNIS